MTFKVNTRIIKMFIIFKHCFVYGMPLNLTYQTFFPLSDIDDCLTDTTCEQVCTDGINTVSCSCRSGFVVDGTDNTRCNRKLTLNM